MMKNFKHFTKRTLALLLALVMCVGLLQLTAFAEETHVHQWTYKSHDTTNHTLICSSCNETKTEAHSFGEWIHIKDATYEEEGYDISVCSGCNQIKRYIYSSGKDVEDGWNSDGESFGTGGIAGGVVTIYTVKWLSGGDENRELATANGIKENGEPVYPNYPGELPTQEGWEFAGWGEPVVDDSAKTITITAQWTEKHVHSYTQTKAPTCEEKGEETCSCGDKREIDALGHIEGNWVDGDTKDAVHTDGCETTQHKEICTRCGAVLDTKDHTYGDWTVTKEPNCTDTGVKEHTCTVCGHKKAEPISKLNHDWQIKNEGDAGHSWVCKNDPEHTKPVEPHNYPDEWTVTKQPTETEPGEKEKVCEDCNHKHTEEIPATKPEKVNVTYQDPDGEEIGKDTPDKGTEYEVKGLPDGVTPPEGKEFDKWQGSDGNEYKPGDKITPDGDLTLTVVWKDKPEEPGAPVPVVPEIVVTPKPSEAPAPSEDPGEEIIDPSEPPLGELPTEPSEAPEPSEPAETDPAESEDLSEEIIDPSEPPLGELPEDLAKPGEPADTDQPGDSFAPGEEPGEDISDGQPPMGNVPEEPGEDISDNRPPMSDAPVSDVPQTGEASNVIWLAATLLAGAGLVVVNTGKRKEERK